MLVNLFNTVFNHLKYTVFFPFHETVTIFILKQYADYTSVLYCYHLLRHLNQSTSQSNNQKATISQTNHSKLSVVSQQLDDKYHNWVTFLYNFFKKNRSAVTCFHNSHVLIGQSVASNELKRSLPVFPTHLLLQLAHEDLRLTGKHSLSLHIFFFFFKCALTTSSFHVLKKLFQHQKPLRGNNLHFKELWVQYLNQTLVLNKQQHES